MINRRLAAAAMLFAVVFLSAALFADDIAREDEIQSMYTDHKAYKVGDIVTVVVIESTEGSQSASLSTNKTAKMQGGMGMSSWGGGNEAHSHMYRHGGQPVPNIRTAAANPSEKAAL